MNTRNARFLIAALALALIGLTGGALANRGSVEPTQQMAVDLTITPSAEHPGAYRCAARFTELASGRVVAEPQVLFRSGEDARMRLDMAFDGKATQVDIVVSASSENRTATVQVDLQRGEARSTLQKVIVTL